MGTTSTGLWYPDGSDNISPLNPVLAAMQTSTDTALQGPLVNTPAGIHTVADVTGLTDLENSLAASGYTVSSANPAYAYRADVQVIYENRGSGWAPYSNTLQFATANDRDTNIPVGNRRIGMVASIGTGSGLETHVWNGTTWRKLGPYQPVAWTPTWGSVTLGNGASIGHYQVVGGLVSGNATLLIESTTVITGGITLTLPLPRVNNQEASVGSASLLDVSPTMTRQSWGLSAQAGTLGSCTPRSPTGSAANATTPWTWAAGDRLGVTFSYMTSDFV